MNAIKPIDDRARLVEIHHTIEKAGENFSRISPNIPKVFIEVTQHIHGRFDVALEGVFKAANTKDLSEKLKCIELVKDAVFFQYTRFEYIIKTKALSVGGVETVLSVLRDANNQLGKWHSSVLKDISKG